MRPFYLIAATLILISCSQHKDKFNYNSSIASITHEAELNYLDARLSFYQNLSEKGRYYKRESDYLDDIASRFKDRVRNGEQISSKEHRDFLNHFEKTFNQSPYVNFEKYNELKKLPLNTVSDVDIVKIYIKYCFFYILNDNKLLPFDSYGPLACAEKDTINNGDPFTFRLSINAFNSRQPFEWYVVKDAEKYLTKENILDTVKVDETGAVYLETRKYVKGTNLLQIVSRLGMTEGDRTLTTSVRFFVK